jgi:hypothetical protein
MKDNKVPLSRSISNSDVKVTKTPNTTEVGDTSKFPGHGKFLICITRKDQQTEQTWKEDIPVKIAVIVQSSSKAFLLKLAGVVLDIFFRQPRG